MSSETTAASEACPEEATIAEFVQGELPPVQAEALEHHLDGCEACGQVVAELVRIFDDGPGGPSGGGEAALVSAELAVTLGAEESQSMPSPIGTMLPPGAEVGRYRVLECVGVGGMGVVYAAYDPQLDRRVALKLLRGAKGDPDHEARNARLLREAQALARLSHPNVIAVHDVGTWEGQVFVAMEFVDGQTLDDWLAERKRSWPEIREVFVAAGRGVAAAHAAGMVHRDFKPDNVLIGQDQRVRVTDFGLARWGASMTSTAELVATDELDAAELMRVSVDAISGARNPVVSLTETGALVGTPAYMAPEQYEHRPADASTDQFAFCVALHEAIYGERPFLGRTVAELASNVLEGKVAEQPTAMDVPRAVRQAIRRGLSRKRADRFASMDELLAVIDQRPVRRWRVAAVVALPALALAAGLLAYSSKAPARSAFCAEDEGLAQVWSTARKEAIREAFLGTGLSYAEDTAARVEAAVDEYAQGWEGLRQRTCSPPEGEAEGPGIAALRERCLVRRRVALDTLLGAFEEADERAVGRAVGAVSGLPQLEGCGDTETLMAELPPPVPADQRDAVEAIRDELARARGLIAAGRYEEGLALAKQLDVEAEGLQHRPLIAETRHILGQLLDRTGDAEGAYEAFEDSVVTGTASRHRRIVAQSLVHQVYVLGVELPRMDEAVAVARRAEAEIEGAQMESDALAAVYLNRGSVAYRRGDYESAAELTRKALALQDREEDPLRWADAAFNLATINVLRGREERAIGPLRDYLEIFEAELGEHHPEVASGYQNLGVAYYNIERYDEARTAIEKAEAIRRETIGEAHPIYAGSVNMLGSIAIAEGRTEEGLALMRRSLGILEAAGSDAIDIADNRAELASHLCSAGRVAEAEREVEQARAVLEQKVPADHPAMASVEEALARIAASHGDAEGLRAHVDRWRALRAQIVGEDNRELEHIDVMRAELLAKAGERDEAIAILHGMLEGDPRVDPWVEPRVRMALAKLLWEEPSRREDARAQVQQAERGFAATESVAGAEQARQWLSDHSGRSRRP